MALMRGHITYFPGLNGLRFITAFLVIIHHIEEIKALFHFPHKFHTPAVLHLGGIGVTFFFVLSGFLITYLLLAEKERVRDISIKKFYIRRILRIWPLYFLIVVSSLFIIPHFSVFTIPGVSHMIHDNFWAKAALFLLFLPQFVLMFDQIFPYASQTWSIGVEEQFYLVWPLLIGFSKKILPAILIIISAFIVFPNLISYTYGHRLLEDQGAYRILYFFNVYFTTLRFSCIALGALAAYILFYGKERCLRVLFRKDIQIICLMVLVCFLFQGIRIKYVNHEVYALLFSIIVLNVAANPGSILNLENSFLNFLGKISYGIYMYHFICIVISIKVLRLFFNDNFYGILSNSLLYLLSLISTILLSTLSYYLLEKKFLNMKYKFTAH